MMISGDFQAMALVLGKFKEMIIHKAFFLLGSKFFFFFSPPESFPSLPVSQQKHSVPSALD